MISSLSQWMMIYNWTQSHITFYNYLWHCIQIQFPISVIKWSSIPDPLRTPKHYPNMLYLGSIISMMSPMSMELKTPSFGNIVILLTESLVAIQLSRNFWKWNLLDPMIIPTIYQYC
jgi:hypothetical protein